MTSWVTYARPFAKRRALYRDKSYQRWVGYQKRPTDDPVEEEYRDGRVEAPKLCAEAIEWMWADFKRAVGLEK